MDNFFESLKQNLENRPEPEFRESAWKAMQKKLIDYEKKHSTTHNKWLWAPPLLMLFLLGSGFLNYYFYQQTQGKLNTPQKKITTVLHIDTVYQKKVIYITDTIIQWQIEQHKSAPLTASPTQRNVFKIDENVFHPNLFALETKRKESTSTNLSYFTTRLLYHRYLAAQQDPPIIENINNTISKPVNKWDKFGIVSLKATDVMHPELPIKYNALKSLAKRKKTLRQMLYPMWPKQFIVGIKGGWILPVQKEINHSNAFSTGLELSAGFSDHLRLFAGFNFIKLNYHIDEMNESLGVPIIVSPGDDYEFLKAEVVQPKLQYTIGMQYLFNVKNKFQPFLGIGFSTAKTLPYELSYEFENDFNDLEAAIEKIIDGPIPLTNQLLFKTGWEYKLTNHWRWKLEGFYNNVLNEKEFYSPNLFGIQTGLLFKI